MKIELVMSHILLPDRHEIEKHNPPRIQRSCHGFLKLCREMCRGSSVCQLCVSQKERQQSGGTCIFISMQVQSLCPQGCSSSASNNFNINYGMLLTTLLFKYMRYPLWLLDLENKVLQYKNISFWCLLKSIFIVTC